MRVFRNHIHVASAAALLAFSIALPAAAGAAKAELSAVNIFNFAKVNGTYYRGGQPDGRDYADLAGLGVKTIIDLQNNGDSREASAAARAGLTLLRVPMSSTSVPSKAQIETFLRLVNDPANQPVYVHCKGGRHRTGIMTAIYRMAREGWTADRAYDEMLEYDFDYGWGHGRQKKFVFAYGAELDRTRPAVATATAQ